MSTIVDELRRWRAPSAVVDTPSNAPLSASNELSEISYREAIAAVLQVKEMLPRLSSIAELLFKQAHAIQDKEEKTALALSRLSESLSLAQANDERLSKALELMQVRFDAVQRMMLLAIEEARSETLRWKEASRLAKEELSTWRSHYQEQLSVLKRHNESLSIQLDELRSGPPGK